MGVGGVPGRKARLFVCPVCVPETLTSTHLHWKAVSKFQRGCDCWEDDISYAFQDRAPSL